MLKGLICGLSLVALVLPASAMCGDRGGPGCRLPNGKCASWAQADYCRTHPEAKESPAPELDQSGKINPFVKRSLLAIPAASGAIMVQLNPPETAALDRWISEQPDPKPSRSEAVHRFVARALSAVE
jgi:hypothetical protein